MVVVVLLLRPFLGLFFPLAGFVRQGLEVVVVRFVPGVHDCDSLAGYAEGGLVRQLVGLRGLLWRIELNEGEVFEFACELVLYLPDVANWHHSFESLEQHVLLNFSHDRPPDH